LNDNEHAKVNSYDIINLLRSERQWRSEEILGSVITFLKFLKTFLSSPRHCSNHNDNLHWPYNSPRVLAATDTTLRPSLCSSSGLHRLLGPPVGHFLTGRHSIAAGRRSFISSHSVTVVVVAVPLHNRLHVRSSAQIVLDDLQDSKLVLHPVHT